MVDDDKYTTFAPCDDHPFDGVARSMVATATSFWAALACDPGAAVRPHSRGRTAGPGRCRGGRGECLCLLASVCGVPAPWWWRAGGLVHYGGVAVLLLLPRNFGSLAVLTGHTGETKLKLFKE
uniref:Uncharacterized protein n=1 Tax=Cacopsylla melanoneura TaxID=428564 RepID=A0A8D9BG06_9HEMI